jgi:hypothetical protein
MDSVASLTKRFQEVAINLDGFAFDPRTGESYRLNATAQFLFKCFRSAMSFSQTVDSLASEYQITKEVAFDDIQDFLMQLKLLGLIQ